MRIRWDDGWRDVTGAVEWLPTEMVASFAEFDRSKNPHRDPKAFARLRESILDRGFSEPLEIHVDGDDVALVEGNHRLVVAQQEGMERVPVVGFQLPPDAKEPTFAPPSELMARPQVKATQKGQNDEVDRISQS